MSDLDSLIIDSFMNFIILMRKISPEGYESLETGSCAIGGAHEYSDWDVVLLDETGILLSKLWGEGWYDGGSDISNPEFISLKQNMSGMTGLPINIIVVRTRESLALWKKATYIAKAFDARDKRLRVAIFEDVWNEAAKRKGEGSEVSTVGEGPDSIPF